jgi:SM-20-related protein
MYQENLILALISRGWYQCDFFLEAQLCDGLLRNLSEFPLTLAKVGKGNLGQINEGLRTDSTLWLSEDSENIYQQEYLKQINTLMETLNRELFLGLRQFEGHFAKYDKNGFYKKHLDQFVSNSERLVSVVTYLNAPVSGGELRIYNRDNSEIIDAEIIPQAGSMVCFLSNQIYHEVRPTNSERYSIAGWLRTTIR